MRQACKLMYQGNIGSIVITKNYPDGHDTERLDTNIKNEMPIGIVTERSC